ncbi:MAG: hypothetical protein OSA97_04980 [Nevskia sp.]|nr:hypothetical protein [Nevskia sp.]
MMLKTLAAIVVLGALSSIASASEEVDRALAVKYLQVSRMDEIINSSIQEYETSMVKKDATPEQRARVHELLESTMGWKAIEGQLADLVMQTYTKDELEAYIAFANTPAGASFTAKSGDFSKRFSTILAGNLQRAIRQKPGSEK